jgi:hypothetical protein
MSSCAKTTRGPEASMLRQEKMGGADTLLKLSVAIDDDLKVLQPYL